MIIRDSTNQSEKTSMLRLCHCVFLYLYYNAFLFIYYNNSIVKLLHVFLKQVSIVDAVFVYWASVKPRPSLHAPRLLLPGRQHSLKH